MPIPTALPQLYTPRLLLRGLSPADITPAYMHWLNDPVVVRCLEIRHVQQDRERIENYLRQRAQDLSTGAHFGVFDCEGQRHVGTVTLNSLNAHHQTADISFVIGLAEAQGRGYASEATHAVVAYAFSLRGLFKLTGGHYASNDGSRKVFLKNGFVQEGRRRLQILNADGQREDIALYGLLAEDFAPATWVSTMTLRQSGAGHD